MTILNESADDVRQMLPLYYDRLFPFKRFIDWLSYDEGPSTLQNREFSFTIRHMNQEVYIRFLSFSTKAEFQQEIMQKCPEKIDIGAVYSGKPKAKNTLKLFKPVQRELVFDIDMTDYDAIRTCCSGANICNKCWKFMTIALRLLDFALRESFGFKHLLFVYSGRRGIHCWICDERARFLSEEARKAIVSFLEVVKGGDQKAKKVSLTPSMHPFLASAKNIIEEYFVDVVLEDQGILDDDAMTEKMLEILPASTRDEVAKLWKKASSSQVKWDVLVEICKHDPKTKMLPTEIAFQYLYPRLDAQVSMHLNHLLKAPFCIHPKTGRVCVPIDINNCTKFDPLAVPTVMTLLQEINDYDANQGQNPEVKNWEKTSMKPYIATFDKFMLGLNEERRLKLAAKKREEDAKMQF